MPAEDPPGSPGDRLESWKEVAAYLKRDVRTVQRWERTAGLPIRRDSGGKLAHIHASRKELDAWLALRYGRPEPRSEEPHPDVPPRRLGRWSLAAVGLFVIVAVTGFWRYRSPRVGPSPGEELTQRRVWAAVQGSDQYGAPSYDGRYLSFGMRRIGLRDLKTGQMRRLTPDFETAAASYSVPSPDAQRVVYSWRKPDGTHQLRLVAVDGMSPRILYDEPGITGVRPFEWSPDGEWILAAVEVAGAGQIALISAATGAKRVVHLVNPPTTRACLSPDGGWVAYEARPRSGQPPEGSSPQGDLFLVPVPLPGNAPFEDLSKALPLMVHPADETLLGWTPHGNRVLFSSDRSGTVDIWTMAVSGGRPHGGAEVVLRDVGAIHPLGLTRSGTLYIVRRAPRGPGAGALMTGELDPATGKWLSSLAPVESRSRYAITGSWSPDGASLAYVADGRHDRRIVIRSLADARERLVPLSLATIADTPPRWSPEGNWLLTFGQDAAGRAGVFRIHASTGQADLLIDLERPLWPLGVAGLRDPRWSRDGRSVFYIQERTEARTCHLRRRDLDSGRDAQIHESPLAACHNLIALSPDGRWLAAGLKQDTRRAIVLVLIPAGGGGAARELFRTAPEGAISSVAWNPDANSLWLALRHNSRIGSAEERSYRLWSLSLEGGPPRPTDLEAPAITDLDVHPDGKRLVFKSAGNRVEVWAIDHLP